LIKLFINVSSVLEVIIFCRWWRRRQWWLWT